MFLYGAGLEQDEATAAQWASAAANSGLQDIIFTYFYTVDSIWLTHVDTFVFSLFNEF